MPRPIVEYRSASFENYKVFSEKYPKINISFDKWKKIIYSWNKAFMHEILETGEKIKLPHGLGDFTINKKKPKKYIKEGKELINRAIDWKETKIAGKIIYHLNNHTDGYRYTWAWFPRSSKIKYSYCWKFKTSRELSRILASYLKQKDSYYKDIYREWINKK